MDVSSIRAAIVLALLLCVPDTTAAGAAPESPVELRSAIRASLDDDRLEEAATLLERYLEAVPDDGAMHYNAACVRGRLGDTDAAGRSLLEAVKAGFLHFSLMRRDPDLDPLRDGDVYRALMAAADAADPLLAERRIREWQETMGGSPYRLERDPARKLNYITALADGAHDALRRRVEKQADRLDGWLFATPLRHTVLIAIPDPERLADLMPDAHAQGRYRHQFHELVAAATGTSLAHELVHVYHHNHMDELGQEHPIWIQEGLASLFETYAVEGDGTIRFLANERDRIMGHYLSRDDVVPSLGELASLSPREFRSNAAVLYAQARSVLRYVAEEDRLERWYALYTEGFRDDESGRAALEAAFDTPLTEIERRWRLWARDVEVGEPASLAAATPSGARPLLRPEPVAERVLAPRGSAVTRLHREARSLAALGRHAEAIARLHELLEREPGHADALYDLGLSCVLTGDMEAARSVHETLGGVDPSLASLLGNLLPAGR